MCARAREGRWHLPRHLPPTLRRTVGRLHSQIHRAVSCQNLNHGQDTRANRTDRDPHETDTRTSQTNLKTNPTHRHTRQTTPKPRDARATTHQSRVLPPETRSLSSASSRGSQPGCQIRSDKSSTQTHTTRATQIQCRKNGRESSPGPVTPRASPAPSPRGSASRYSSVSLATKYREQAEDIGVELSR